MECDCFTGGSPFKISEVKACDEESDLIRRTQASNHWREGLRWKHAISKPGPALQTPEGRMLCMVPLSCLARGISRPRLQDAAQPVHPHETPPTLAKEMTATRTWSRPTTEAAALLTGASRDDRRKLNVGA